MDDHAANVWLVLHLAARSLEHGNLRTFWPEFERYASRPGVFTRGVAAIVWLGLRPVVPFLAARRRRLVARALEGVVRAIVAGVDVGVALDRGVAWLVRKGLDRDQAQGDLQRLLTGFLSGEAPGGAVDRRRPAVGRGSSSAR